MNRDKRKYYCPLCGLPMIKMYDGVGCIKHGPLGKDFPEPQFFTNILVSDEEDAQPEEAKAVSDSVNHPDHYTQYRGFEVIDVCEQLRSWDETGNFNRGNAFKYLARAGWKNVNTEIEDLEKAKFYIQREIDRRKKEKREISELRFEEVDMTVRSSYNGFNEMVARVREATKESQVREEIETTPDLKIIPRCPQCQMPLMKSRSGSSNDVYYCTSGHGQMIYPKRSYSATECHWVKFNHIVNPEH